MPRHIAFLRAINVGGHTVTMDRLRQLFEALGLDDVETFIASGNVIFRSAARAATLEAKIEQHLQQALGYEVATFIRSDAEVANVARYRPFTAASSHPPVRWSSASCATRSTPPRAKAVLALRTDIDDLHVNGREMYWMRRAGRQSDSKLSNTVFERTLKAKATFRNINTMTRLAARYPSI